MRFADLHIKGDGLENFGKVLDFSKSLGFDEIVLCFTEKNLERMKDIGEGFGLGIELHPESTSKLERAVGMFRKNFEILYVAGGNIEINRAAAELPQIDLLNPVGKPNDFNAFNHVIARLCKKNSVSVCFDFSSLLHTHGRERGIVLSKIKGIANLIKKFSVPFVLASGAESLWDLRSPHELISFGRILGFQDSEILKAISGEILKENRKRLSKKWVMPGVEVESD